MDQSSLIISLLKENKISKKLNILTKHCLKAMFDPLFDKRNKLYGNSLKIFFCSMANYVDISLFDESAVEYKDSTMIQDNTTTLDIGIESLNITFNKENSLNLSNICFNDTEWCLTQMLKANDEYILESKTEYVITNLIKEMLFEKEDLISCKLFLSYKLFCSTKELIFCLKLVEQFPKSGQYAQNHLQDQIKSRIRQFYSLFMRDFGQKVNSCQVLDNLIGENWDKLEDSFVPDIISLSFVEPELPDRHVSYTKLIKEGIFFFSIEEVKRQLCIVEHEFFSELTLEDVYQFIKNQTAPIIFEQLNIRQKQVKSYILLFILLQNALENKRLVIKNFIALAYSLKMSNCYQSAFTIIETFHLIGITKKHFLWNQIDIKHQEMFIAVEKEYEEFETKDYLNDDHKLLIIPSIPGFVYLNNFINNFIIRMKNAEENENLKISHDFTNFCLKLKEIKKNKYSFFKVNPLYDFLKHGYKEIFKPKRWDLKFKLDLYQYIDDSKKLDNLIEFLVKSFKKLDNY